VIKRLAWQWFIGAEPRCSLREFARRLGVSQTYIQKLVLPFRASPRGEPIVVARTYGQPCTSVSRQL